MKRKVRSIQFGLPSLRGSCGVKCLLDWGSQLLSSSGPDLLLLLSPLLICCCWRGERSGSSTANTSSAAPRTANEGGVSPSVPPLSLKLSLRAYAYP